jgi:hypothetical protein
VAHKVEQIRDDLGSVGAVLSDQVGDAMLGELRAIDDDAVDRARSRPATKVLQVERKLREGLARCHERLQASISDLHLSPERVERVVATALELAHQPSLEDGTEEGTFWLPALSGSWQRTSEGMADRLSGEPMPFTFDGEQARGRDDVVLAHLGHRLVAQSLRLLRAEVWATGEARNLARVTARSVPVHPDLVEAGDIGVVCHARLVITGSDGHRLHEELVVAGGRIRGGRFSRIDAQRDLATLIDAAGEAASTADLAAAVASWERVGEPGVQRALERRAEDVQDSKQRELQRRLEVEADAVRAVLTDLQNQITAELSDLERERAEQLSLFDAPEADQSQRDLDALSRRVEEIPDEIEREIAAIRRRYTDPESHVFPAAITFLVPGAV